MTFTASRPGEALLEVTAAAPDTDWGRAGSESAVANVIVDGRRAADVVLFEGARTFTYRLALGPVEAGQHTVSVAFDGERSPAGAHRVVVKRLSAALAPAGDLAARFSPIVVGRDINEVPGAYENNRTDVPLTTYHTTARNADGTTTIEYTMVWSNEDGGTSTPALMARWGRTTDIEWIYRVKVGADGRPIAESYQAPSHQTLPYTGTRVGDHPVLRTATANNNMLAVTSLEGERELRFFPDTSQTLPAGRAREAVMDANPWTYEVMAKELVREGKIESPADPDTQAVSDQRNYVFAEVKKSTAYASAPASGSWAGTALAVKLAGSDRWYTSHHGVPDWSIQRDDPAATTVELPPGTTADQVEAVKAIAVPVGSPPDYTIDVTALNRGFLLGTDFTPGASFLNWQGDVRLDPAHPEAVIWQRQP